MFYLFILFEVNHDFHGLNRNNSDPFDREV